MISLRHVSYLILCVSVVWCCGCVSTRTSNTARTAKEQLLISNSVDRALEKVDFRPFVGSSIYVEEKYLDCVDKNYVVASIRHRVLRSGAHLVNKPEQADVVLEVRSGAVGTDTKDWFLGMPKIALPGPLPLSLPEIKLIDRKSQNGIAKLGIVAYEAKTGQRIGPGGVSVAQSDDNNWFVLGMGPYQNGSVRTELSGSTRDQGVRDKLPTTVAFGDMGTLKTRDSSKVRLTSEQQDR